MEYILTKSLTKQRDSIHISKQTSRKTTRLFQEYKKEPFFMRQYVVDTFVQALRVKKHHKLTLQMGLLPIPLIYPLIVGYPEQAEVSAFFSGR